MSNKFGIPVKVKEEIRKRDKRCVYCHIRLHAYTKKAPGGKATLEHLNFNGPFKWKDDLKKQDLATCCNVCNSSRGRRKLLDWFEGQYCKKEGKYENRSGAKINKKTVAKPVKDYIRRNPKK